MKRSSRLTQSNDFKRVRRIGKSYAHPLIVLVCAPNDLNRIRVAVVAGARVGGAVQRNRIKRQMRAILHAQLPLLKPGKDVIFIARPPAAQASFADLKYAIQQLARRAALTVTEENDLVSPSGISG